MKKFINSDINNETGHDFRHRVRRGQFNGPTAGQAPGYIQGNIVILPVSDAHDFLLYCLNNPKPCPLIGLSKMGEKSLPGLGEDIDISRDIPKYHIFIDGKLKEKSEDIGAIWRDDFVTFVLGCSFTFEQALVTEGYRMRHIDLNKNVSMYRTNIPSISSGIFSGPLVVTMRPFTKANINNVYAICSQYNHAHGAPIFFGDPRQIGIENLSHPDYGDAVTVNDNELPVFWACGVTTQEALKKAKPKICITQAPGYMLVSDIQKRVDISVDESVLKFFREDNPTI